jgi:probable rRNA maturation factor
MARINFFSEETTFKLAHPIKTSKWIKAAIQKEKKVLDGLNFIFCTDDYLLKINKEYLNHNTLTDIVTFDNSETRRDINGDIFISVDRVSENAKKFNVSFDQELHRVIIHGILHLIGYGDKDMASKAKMRKKEDAYLSLRN